MSEVSAKSKGRMEVFELNKHLSQVLSLELTNAPYLIIAKVVLYNDDDGAQNATAKLRRLNGGVSEERLDEATVRLAAAGGADRAEVSLQVGIDFKDLRAPVTVELACSTYEGNASHAKLAALQLDFLNDKPG